MMGLGIHLVSVLLLAVLVEIACRLGRFRPAICHALWLIVLVKLVVPPVVAWPLDAVGVNFFVLTPTAESVDAVVPDAGESVARLSFSDSENAGSKTLESTGAFAPVNRDALGRGVGFAALGLWVLGAAVVLGRLLWQAKQARRMVATGESAPPWLQAQLHDICTTLNLSAPRVVIVNTGCGGVYVHFIGRPVLVISSNALEYIERDQWHTILTHEMAHLKRRDHWVAWLMLAASVAWWWNPCLWWVRNRIHLHSELACDAWVVHTYPEERKNYAETMVRVLRLLSERFEPAPAMGLAVWSSATQERRLWMVMKGTSKSTMGWMYGAGLALLGVVLSPAWIAVGVEEVVASTSPQPLVSSATAPLWTYDNTPTEALQNLLAETVEIELADSHIRELIGFVQDTYGVNIALDQRCLAPLQSDGESLGPVTADETNATPDPLLPELNGGENTRTDGRIPFIKLLDTPMEDVLKATCRPLGLVYEAFGNVVWITNSSLQEADWKQALPHANPNGGGFEDELLRLVDIELSHVHLKEVVELIQDQALINVVWDGRVIKGANGTLITEPGLKVDHVTDGIIQHINLQNVTVAEALYVVTRQLGLSYRLRPGFVFISSHAILESESSKDNEPAEPTP